MNKNFYRLIYSRTHGELRVVSELARSCGNGPGQYCGPGVPKLWVTIRRAVWFLGAALFASPVMAGSIVADGAAAPGQRPDIINTQNGLPQVNITAPNQAGVSHNQYQQFDIDRNGAILNNSALMTSTQMAGMIQGNPNLNPNAAPARVILNEVNSNNPSQLRGFLEVAGGRAQVIVANPAGITCNGCGTINAGRMTLTTGKPQLNVDGSLAGYQVERGIVRIEGGGLNGDSRHDTAYVDLLARAVEVNAGVWAKEELSVVAGQNHISVDGKIITPLSKREDAKPELAIDMGQMGGMYSGFIRMIGTESGIGVRNQGGHIQADKTLTVTSEGSLVWVPSDQQAVTQARGDITLTAKGNIEYHGKLHSGGMLSVRSLEGRLEQSGTLAAAGNVRLTAANGMRNRGNLLAGSDVNSQLVNEADLILNSQGNISVTGSMLSKRDVILTGQKVDISQGTLAARQAKITADESDVALRQTKIDSDRLIITAAKDVDARQAKIRVGQWDVKGRQLSNQKAVWSQVGDDQSHFALSDSLDNTDGSIEAHNLQLRARMLNNKRGRLVAIGASTQRWQIDDSIDNSDGELGSNGDLILNAAALNNQKGTVKSQSALSVDIAGTFDNRDGIVQSGRLMKAEVNSLNNAHGTFQSAEDMTLISHGDVINQSGVLTAQQTLSWQGNRFSLLDNDSGSLQSGGSMVLAGGRLSNRRQGDVLSEQTLSLTLNDELDNRGGKFTSNDAMTVHAGSLLNAQGDVNALGSLNIQLTQTLDNANGNIFSRLAQTLKAQDIFNMRGWMGSLSNWTAVSQYINNNKGSIQNQLDSQLTVNTFNNAEGVVQSAAKIILRVANDIDNRAGKISAQGPINIVGRVANTAAGRLNNISGQLLSGGALKISALRLDNTQGGRIYSQGSLQFNLKENLDNREGKLLSDGGLRGKAQSLQNANGVIDSEQLDLRILGLLDNRQGAITSNDEQKISAGQIDNRHGIFSSQAGLDVSTGWLNNRNEGVLIGSKHTSIAASEIDNRGGNLQSAGSLTIKGLSLLDNRHGLMLANGNLNINAETSLSASFLTLLNQHGVIQSGEELTLRTLNLDNRGGKVQSQRQLNLSIQQDYTHRAGDTLSSNQGLNLMVAGVLTNLTDWFLPGSMTVNSTNFTNSGSLVSQALELTTGSLLNLGRLEADQLHILADTLDNAADIIGDDVNIHSRSIDNHGANAVIAATRLLDLQADERLTHRESALLYSSGDMHLDSPLIENRASAIEADGDITLQASHLNNLREGEKIQQAVEKNKYKWHRYNYYWRSYDSPVNTDKSTMAPITQSLTFRNDDAAKNNRYGTLLNIDAENKRAQVRVKNSYGELTDLWINYLALKNNKDGSYAITFYGTRGFRQTSRKHNIFGGIIITPTPYQNMVWREVDRGSIELWDPKLHVDIASAPFISDYNNFRERSVTGTVVRDKLLSAGTAAHILAGRNMMLNIGEQLLNDASTITANGDLNIVGNGKINNKGYSVNERRQEYIVDHYDKDTHHWYPTFNRDETTALATLDAVISSHGNNVIKGSRITNTTVNQAQISKVDAARRARDDRHSEQDKNPLAFTVDDVTRQSAHTRLIYGDRPISEKQHLKRVATFIPDNGLFRQHPAVGSPFLVVTDERFTSRSKFISSDYLLSRVGYKPEQVHKRLGDGFYEQRLVREQLLQLTGRPSVRGDNMVAQYQNLMNHGVKAAEKFQLVPGVALTPEQIAALRQDIVWLVGENVKTASGQQTVWVPKVYLASNTLRLTDEGALIGGGDLHLSADSINNAGNLFANHMLDVKTGRFMHHSGDINANNVDIKAESLNLSTNLQDALRQATIKANNITLSATDIHLQGARLDAKRNLDLLASNNLDITAARSSHAVDLNVISGAMGNRSSDGMEKAGQRMARVKGEWQQAAGTQLNVGTNLNVKAGNDITVRGSQVRAGGRVTMQAGGDIELLAEKTTNSSQLTANSRTSFVHNSRKEERLLLSTLSGDGGATFEAGHTLHAEGVLVDSQRGRVDLNAQDVNIKGARKRIHDWDSERGHSFLSEGGRIVETSLDKVAGSVFSGRDGISVYADEGNIVVSGSTLHSAYGDVTMRAQKDVLLNSATEYESQYSDERSQKSGVVNTTSRHTVKEDRMTHEKGSLVSGDHVSITSGNDLTIRGSAVAADRELTLQASNNIDITAARETEFHYFLDERKKSGLLGTGGIGFSVGTQSTRHQINEEGTTQSQSMSTVGSNQGNLSIRAGNKLHIGGADLVAGKDLTLIGDSVQIDPGSDQISREEIFEQKQSGLTLALSGSVGEAINVAVAAARASQQESDSRLAALQATKSALAGVQAYQAQQLSALNAKEGEKGEASVGVMLSAGTQSSRSRTHLERRVMSASTLNAGRDLNITATGGGHDATSGDINISGSQLKAGRDASLDAARDIHLSASADRQKLEGSNSSSGGSLGVGLTAGSGGTGLTFSASANAARGSEHGNGTTWNETTLDAGNRASLKSGRDTALTGAQVSAGRITANTGRDLTLRSLQDSDRYDSRQQSVSAGASATLDVPGGSASLSFSRDRLHSNYDSVREQTGLFAGDGGFDVTTGRHTQLDGAVIASTAGAGKNRLDTGTLGFSDLHNQADFRTEHQGASVSTRAGFDPAANLYSNAANIAMAGAGHGGHDEGTTRAAVSDGAIRIRDRAGQQQSLSGLSRDADRANGSIGQIFDKEKEQRRLQAAQLIGEIGGQVSDIARTQGQIAGEQAKRDPAALKRAEAQLAAAGNRKPTPQQIAKQAYNNAMAPFGTGSSLQQALSAATAAVQGLAGGNMAQALSGAAAPYLAEQIHIMTTDPVTGNLNTSANLMAHAVLGAVTAQLQDGSALAGAAGASAGEYIAQQLYPGVDKSKLSEEQKQSISALSTLAAGLAGGLASDSGAGALSGAQAGKNAVENNALSLPAGMAAYGQAVASWNQYAEANDLTDAEKQAGLKKLAEGDMPEYANVTKVIVEGSTDGAILAGAWYLGPAATIWEVAASGTIGAIANGTYQWFDINSRENQSKPLNERKTWDYWSSGSAVVTGALAPGRGVWQNVGIAVGGSVFTDGPDVGAIGISAAGAGLGGAFGKYAPIGVDKIVGDNKVPGVVYDGLGSLGTEFLGGYAADLINTPPKADPNSQKDQKK